MAGSVPSTMKAAYRTTFGPLEETLEVRAGVAIPKDATTLPPESLLVKVSYTSLNPFDYKIAENPLFGRLLWPGVPCLDFSGTVIESTSSRFTKDVLVYGQTQPMNFAACAEYVVVKAEYCMTLPKGMKLEDAATVGVAGLMAYQTIVPFAKKGDRLFINGGSGGVGTYEIQIAKAIGCNVTTACSGANAALCKSLGADEVIDYRTQDVIETLQKSKEPFDLVIDNIFMDTGLYWHCHEYLKPEGKYLTVAGSPDLTFIKDVVSITLWPQSLGGGQRAFRFVGRKPNSKDYAQIAEWMEDGIVKAVIEEVFDLDDICRAFARLKSGRARGKLVVAIDPA